MPPRSRSAIRRVDQRAVVVRAGAGAVRMRHAQCGGALRPPSVVEALRHRRRIGRLRMVQHAFRRAVHGIEHRPGEMAVVDVCLYAEDVLPHPLQRRDSPFPTSRHRARRCADRRRMPWENRRLHPNRSERSRDQALSAADRGQRGGTGSGEASPSRPGGARSSSTTSLNRLSVLGRTTVKPDWRRRR